MENTGLLRRIGAMLYDGLLLFAVLMLVGTPFVAVRGGEAVEPLTDPFFRLTLAATVYLFFVGFWMRAGRTLGMQSWRLQLETAEGGKPTLGACTIRFFAALLSWAPAGLGFWWQLWDKEHLTWHDRLSGTRIVHYPKK
ncbi:MAG: RDD family protein [Woeseiaceae bacterium]|nr:RDD family protein [Woeseiaceae bacterium]